ncbi:hypothetical protein DT075_36540 [Bacillus licheniformis]|nr:hypothetical protein DT075_36540 [Bacillus licheniformis]
MGGNRGSVMTKAARLVKKDGYILMVMMSMAAEGKGVKACAAQVVLKPVLSWEKGVWIAQGSELRKNISVFK